MAEAPKPMLAADVVKHPEYPYVIWDLKPEKKGKVAVAKDRYGPIDIAYEVHGRGPRLLVWIMGLGAFKTTWQRQTKDFAHTQSDKYTSLIFDNRGMGESDKPLRPFSTSDMALDLIELLDHLGWTKLRQVHIIGISMGGMIAQEVAIRIPERIASLSLVSTASGIFNTVGYFENLRNRINLFIPKPIDTQLAHAKHNIWTTPWLLSPDELASESHIQPFPTNGDRFSAFEITKRSLTDQFTRKGFITQAIAANWHFKSPGQLREIAEGVGRGRILVVHGRGDRMISFQHAGVLVEGLNGGAEEGEKVKTIFIDEGGHMLPAEMRKEFNSWVEEVIEKGSQLNAQEGVKS